MNDGPSANLKCERWSPLALLVAIALALPVSAKEPAKPVTKAAATSTIAVPERVTSVEGITEYKLVNGLRVLLFPDQSKPTITVNITYSVQ